MKRSALAPFTVEGFPRRARKALEKPLEIHCIGGFALVYYYGIPRTTEDIDYYTAVPADLNLEEIAGHDFDLHRARQSDLTAITATV